MRGQTRSTAKTSLSPYQGATQKAVQQIFSRTLYRNQAPLGFIERYVPVSCEKNLRGTGHKDIETNEQQASFNLISECCLLHNLDDHDSTKAILPACKRLFLSGRHKSAGQAVRC